MKKYSHSCVLQCMKRISRGRDTVILQCRGCGAKMNLEIDSTPYRTWEKLQQGKKRDAV